MSRATSVMLLAGSPPFCQNQKLTEENHGRMAAPRIHARRVRDAVRHPAWLARCADASRPRVSVLFTEKRGTKRWFSVKDIAVLRIAHELERSGRSWLMAIGQAFDHLERPPDPDALLIAPAVIRRGCGLPRIVRDRDVPRLNFERSEIVIPIGRIVSEITKEAALVWSP
ncbi:hypothetical protein [Mesorhizobium huakuii]|uniref:Uncharacterized protein n=1 Tax=Mesorhizobium huakuii TaxID=28104 RepID=A0A7G6SZB5_9HYPH|nr:hypothetical protein [Mesorhizobium huakuii]QND59847.1 hypothetical protein HB778_27290 [Mesorhizobium huakuii]